MRRINQLYPYCEDPEAIMKVVRWAYNRNKITVADMEKEEWTLSSNVLRYLKCEE